MIKNWMLVKQEEINNLDWSMTPKKNLESDGTQIWSACAGFNRRWLDLHRQTIYCLDQCQFTLYWKFNSERHFDCLVLSVWYIERVFDFLCDRFLSSDWVVAPSTLSDSAASAIVEHSIKPVQRFFANLKLAPTFAESPTICPTRWKRHRFNPVFKETENESIKMRKRHQKNHPVIQNSGYNRQSRWILCETNREIETK